MNRAKDWLAQAERDLRHARNALEDGDYEWSCFAAQQAAEKAVKALIFSLGGEPWGHSVTALVDSLPEPERLGPELVDASKRLDKHYIPARYPNGFDSGHPGSYYTRGEAEQACNDAEAIVQQCRGRVARS